MAIRISCLHEHRSDLHPEVNAPINKLGLGLRNGYVREPFPKYSLGQPQLIFMLA